MNDVTIGEHDPMVFQGGSHIGVWVECECSWISNSFSSAAYALKAHAKHVERVSS